MMTDIWMAIAPGPRDTRVIAMAGASETILKARLALQPAHARAMSTLLEAIALWQGTKVRAALCADARGGVSDSSLFREAFTDFGGPLYSVDWVPAARHVRRRHRDIDGVGPFADLRRILISEVARGSRRSSARASAVCSTPSIGRSERSPPSSACIAMPLRLRSSPSGSPTSHSARRRRSSIRIWTSCAGHSSSIRCLRATRLLQMIQARGYSGSVWPLRRFVRRIRPMSSHEAFFRLSTLPGEQGQVDWGSFGSITVGNTRRALSCFVMVLSWSRALFARFVLDQTLESFLRCHVGAFAAFGGTPRSLLYDNLKTAVLERVGDVIRFHPRLLELAGHYHFAPKPVARARGNEKGRVERAIRYIRDSFFAARSFHSLDDLNRQLDDWTERVAHARLVPRDAGKRSVGAAFQEERTKLLPLPAHPLPCDLVRAVVSGKTPYLRFDGNDYSIPHTFVRRPVTLIASDTVVRVLHGDDEVARHSRSWERGRQFEEACHLEALASEKRSAREHRGRNRLMATCPSAEPFLQNVALHGGHLGGTTTRLLHLLDQYGAAELEFALAETHRRGAFAAQSVAHVLDQRRRARKTQVPIPVVLPDDPRVRDLVIPTRSLGSYDVLARSGHPKTKRNGHE